MSHLAVPALILPTTPSATEHASRSSKPTATPFTNFLPPVSSPCQASCKPHSASSAPAAGSSPEEEEEEDLLDFFLVLLPLVVVSASLALARQKSGLAAISATALKNLERQSSDSFAGKGATAIRSSVIAQGGHAPGGRQCG